VSRGYGELQRKLLPILTEHGDTADRWRGLDTVALARAAHGRKPTRGEVVSVRRALAALMRNGEVRIHMSYGHRHYQGGRLGENVRADVLQGRLDTGRSPIVLQHGA
jgi:hypothetical protein